MQKSPFPGMDPYLELHWLDVHSALVTYARDQLQDRLPSDLCARMEERVVLEDEFGLSGPGRHPDVRVIEEEQGGVATAVAVATQTLADPDLILVQAETEPHTERYVEIVDAKTRTRVITSIEFISPTNKRPGPGRDKYLAKQDECRAARVNRVEIDLTRAGSREEIMPWLASLKPPHPTYLAGVWRAVRGDAIEVHLLPLDKPLKSLRIPLRPADKDVVLDLQPLVEQAYHRGRYGNLDYTRALEPPLTGPEAEIAERVVTQARNK